MLLLHGLWGKHLRRLAEVESMRRLRERRPEARVIILITIDDNEYVFEGLRAGALGYLLMDVSGRELAKAIRVVAGGSRMAGHASDPQWMRRAVACAQPGYASV